MDCASSDNHSIYSQVKASSSLNRFFRHLLFCWLAGIHYYIAILRTQTLYTNVLPLPVALTDLTRIAAAFNNHYRGRACWPGKKAD
jgi:hypothetical protein